MSRAPSQFTLIVSQNPNMTCVDKQTMKTSAIQPKCIIGTYEFDTICITEKVKLFDFYRSGYEEDSCTITFSTFVNTN